LDVTERKQAEMKLKQILDNLENVVKERTAELETAEKTLKIRRAYTLKCRIRTICLRLVARFARTLTDDNKLFAAFTK
jgi:hypothetical protein